MKLVNCTNHTLAVVGPMIEIPVSGHVARVQEQTSLVGALTIENESVPLISKRYGSIEGLPPPQEGVLYVTSTIVAIAAWEDGRRDVVAPGDLARDRDGNVKGCLNFVTAS